MSTSISIDPLRERQLADTLGAQAAAVLLGDGVEPLAQDLIADGADIVYLVENPLLKHYRTDAYAKVLCDLIQRKKPEVVLFGATTVGRDLAPRISQRIYTGLTADWHKLAVEFIASRTVNDASLTSENSIGTPEDGQVGEP